MTQHMPPDEPKQKVARTWRDFIYARFHNLDPYYKKLDKNEVEQFLASEQVRTARVYERFGSAASIRFETLPDTFVLKPTSLASRRGVMVLHRQAGNGVYWDALHRVPRTESHIISEQEKWEALVAPGKRLEFIAEERLVSEDGSDRIPFDYKLFTFLDQVGFILQIDRNTSPPSMAFFINGFETFNTTSRIRSGWKSIQPGMPQVPDCAGPMLRLATRVCWALQTPFVSVDCYATPEGPVVGELTFTPGLPYYGRAFRFTREFSAELGLTWREVNRRLGRDNPLVPVGYVVRKSSLPMKV